MRGMKAMSGTFASPTRLRNNMPKKTVTILTCDICGAESDGQSEKGWLHWSQEDSYQDRSWIERYLCPACLEDIQTAIKRQKID